MNSRIGELNEKWAKQLIKELVHQGVRYFCIAPGSRSTPLTLAASSHPLTKTFVHFDERALCFHALGYGKATGFPAAVIVTSGTAVGNLLPAVMEAHHDHIPMILLTSDRPPELRDVGANQTSDQVKIFQNFVRWQIDFPCPDSHIAPAFIGSTIACAISHTLSQPSGPVQLNCMFREPFCKLDSTSHLTKSSPTHLIFGNTHLTDEQIASLADELFEYEKGIIIVSALPPNSSLTPLFNLARLLKWPIFPDILSPARLEIQSEELIPYYDLILSSLSLNEDLTPDAILQFGDRFISKKLIEWISMKKNKCHVLVAPHNWRIDPMHSLTHRLIASPWQVIRALSHKLPSRLPSMWLSCWQEMNRITQQTLTHFFEIEQTKAVTEPAFFHHLSSWLKEDIPLFLGNSLPIRQANSFFVPLKKCGPIFCNRGLSGIDGNIATAAGIAKGLGKPLLAIIGDLTFLHDLTSLFQIKKLDLPITLIVMNNDGGGLFSFLPIAKHQDVFKPFFLTPHGLDLKQSAPLFNLSYTKVTSLKEIEPLLYSFNTQSMIIEVLTDHNETLTVNKQIFSCMKEVLSITNASLA